MAPDICPSCSSTARAQRQAFGLQAVVFFGLRDLDQIGRGRQRRVDVARRQLDLIKQIRPLPVQFRLERLRVQRFQNRRRAGKIVLREFRLRQQQLSARNQFIRRIQLRRALKHAVRFLQQRHHLRPFVGLRQRRRRLHHRPQPQR